MSNEILLYDLPSCGKCECWSPNTWKTRVILNYKNLPYKTEFVPFHKLQETLKATGMQPNEEGVAWVDYSVPAIKLPDGSYVMDSVKITKKLEELYPEPSLHLETGMHEKVGAAIGQASKPLLPVFMPIIGRSVVHESDSEWFETDRSKKFGMPMAEFEKAKGGQQAWDAAKPGLKELKKVMTENKKDEGPFVMGSTVTYGDLMLLGFLKFFKQVGIYDKWVQEYEGPEMEAIWEAGKKWVEKVD